MLRDKWWWDYVLIFTGGFIWDSVLSVDTILTAHFSATGAFGSTVCSTLLSYFMYAKIVDRVGDGLAINWNKVWTLALGSGAGAAVTTLLMGL